MPDGSRFITPIVSIDGKVLPAAFALLSLEVSREVNRIPSALLSIRASGPMSGQARLLAGGPFAPASEVEIKLRGTDGKDVHILKGLVTALAVHASDSAPTLDVTIKDMAVRLAGARHSKIWTDTKDSDAIRAVVTAARLTMGRAPDTQIVHKALVQYEATDWDFILSRADALGLVAVVRDGTVSLVKMDPSVAAVRSFTLGMDAIRDMAFELDAATQLPSLTSHVWDPQELAATAPADAEILSLPQGGIRLGKVGEALGFGPAHLAHMVPLPRAEAKAWAASRAARARLALIRGRLSVPGWPAADLMQVASLTGFGHRFDGNALITGVYHRLDDRGFTTDLEFGLPPEPVGRLSDIADMPAGGLLPPAAGLQTGIVIANVDDPDQEGRIKISVPAIASGSGGALWARVACPDAGPKRGFCFMPEVGDEVLVAFLNGDPRHPIVLGRLHGRKNTPPDGFNDTRRKAIVTAKDVRIVFDEADKPAVTISTPGGRTVTLDDDGQAITLSDKGKNKIKLDGKGINIESGNELTLKASGAVKIIGRSIDLN